MERLSRTTGTGLETLPENILFFIGREAFETGPANPRTRR